MTFYQILSTSTKKSMDISLENLIVDMRLTVLSEHCVVPENIHTPPHRRDWKFQGGGGGSQRPKKLSKCMKLGWNFQRGGGGGSKGKSFPWGRSTFFNESGILKGREFTKRSI